MPELPEVETIRKGLAPRLEGARIETVELRRADLRYPFPVGLTEVLSGKTIERLGRRAKYLLFGLSGGQTLIAHLGMSGSFRFGDSTLAEPSRLTPAGIRTAHDHLLITSSGPDGPALLIYNDPRRFGFFDLTREPDTSPHLNRIGPEPLGNGFNTSWLAQRCAGRRTPIKSLLLDQRTVAGLGNIYVCEALHRAGIAPARPAGTLVDKTGRAGRALERLVPAIRAVLDEAIAAGGSSLKDYRNAEGELGYFQHRFAVYDREATPCPHHDCTGTIGRTVLAGRSTFFCPVCQH